MIRLFIRLIIVFFIGIVALAFFPSSKHATPVSIQVIPETVSHHAKAEDFAPGQLQAHFIKHGYQFGAISESDYLEDARKLLDTPAGNDVLEKIRDNGDILHYKPSTHEFAVMTSTGRIRTYFKAEGDQYWEKQ